jgi:VRR-NUC domain
MSILRHAPAAARDLFGRNERRIPLDRNAEARRQAAIVEYVRWCAPDVVIFAVPNGGLRTKAEAARLKWTGVLAGALDLALVLPGARCAFWETKTPRGRLSDDQKAFIRLIEARGHTWAVVRAVEDARAELARLGIRTREARA